MKRVFSIILSLLACITLVNGFAIEILAMENSESAMVIEENSSNNENKLEIMAYYGPSIGINLKDHILQSNKNSATVQDVKKYFDAGFDYIVAEDAWYYSNRYDEASGQPSEKYDALYMLDLIALYCDEYGITDPKDAPVIVACGYLNGAMEGSYGDHIEIQIEYNIQQMYENLKSYVPAYPDNYVAKTNNTPLNCFAGFALRDEPWGKHMDYYTQWYKFLVDDLKVLDEGYKLIGSMLGMNAAEYNVTSDESGSTEIGITATQYLNYLNDFITTVNATTTSNQKEYIMYDNYPFVQTISRTRSGWPWNYQYSYATTHSIRERYFENLAVVAQTAKENNMKAGICIQSMAHYNKALYNSILGTGGNDSYTYHGVLDDVSYISMQVYAALAYGYQRLDYFTYWQPFLQTEAETFIDAAVMWDEIGNGFHYTNMYNYMKEVNTEVKKFDELFMEYDWQGTRTVSGSIASGNVFGNTQSYTSNPTANAVNSQYDLLIGCFEKNGNNAYMAVNVDHPNNNRNNVATFNFGTQYSKVIAYINGVQQTIYLTNGALQLSLGKGEGVFLIPVQ